MTVSPAQPGIAVSTSIAAGAGDPSRLSLNHAEGIVVSTAVTAGVSDPHGQHVEGLVAR